ncbi:hypothetical protein [Actinomadura sp. DC4]|uniref:hypothetical protein n=1 Tax=Actinomadura sp. DC4 TaxID=3055069 RepID=UPI0025B05283|nr:hypothetical protein [Actinomadura sp. DC4]MDN3352084.1 hypothetical protein [Actinomadura sp. DC4]
MIADASVNTTHGRRWALLLFMFVGVVLHSSLCPPGAHAGVLGAPVETCVVPVEPSSGVAAGADRAGEAGRPCRQAPRPHHHAPCGVMTHRASPQERSAGPWQAGAPLRSSLPAPFVTGVPGHARLSGMSSLPPVRRSGAGLLIDLCASRT